MTQLIIASLVFLATHYVSSTPLRDALVAHVGRRVYLAVYTLVAFATLGWMIRAFYHAPFVNLWYAVSLRAVPLVVMPVALIFFVCAVTAPNPSALGQEKHLKSTAPARGIVRVTRHPFMWSFGVWALSHLIARGDAASVIFFGSFALLALSGTVLIDRRKASGDDWQRFAAVTSNIPFAAILAGRNRLMVSEIGWWRIALGLVLYGVLLQFHHALFGAQPTL